MTFMQELRWCLPIICKVGFRLIYTFGFGLIAMVLHEFGHFLSARALGIRVKRIGLCWKGVYVVREAGSPLRSLCVSLAGPLTNATLLLFWHWSKPFALANLCFALVNILPFRGSDGDRVLNYCGEIHRRSLACDPITLVVEPLDRPVAY